MEKILISLMDFYNDFIIQNKEPTQINTTGPLCTLNRDLYHKRKYSAHHIVVSGFNAAGIEKRKKILEYYLKDQFPGHSIVYDELKIRDEDLPDFEITQSCMRTYMLKFKPGVEIDVVADSGTAVMRMAWVALFATLSRPFNLFVMVKAEYTRSGQAELFPVLLTKNERLDNVVREVNIKKTLPKEIFRDQIIQSEFEKAKAVANSDTVNILVLGETGTGKDLIARFIKENSPLKDKPFESINCASISDEFLSSELFGHVAGAYTGALRERPGLFETCNGGTLFMDEIGDITPFMQQSLLRALENGEIRKLGSDETIRDIKVRIIAATNADLLNKCEQGKFRWDLYYRLCDVEIELTPYRERTTKQREMAIRHFLKQYENEWGREIGFKEEAWSRLLLYQFPGNFRELKNTVNGLFSLQKKEIEVNDLPKRITRLPVSDAKSMDAVMKRHTESIFNETNGNMAATCRILGYKNPHTFKAKLEKWGII